MSFSTETDTNAEVKSIIELEKERGCSHRSKLFEIADEVKHLYCNLNKSNREIAQTYKKLGVTPNMVAGYIHRNGLKHTEIATPLKISDQKNVIPLISADRILPPAVIIKELMAKRQKSEEQLQRGRVGFPKAKTILEQAGGCWMYVGPEPLSPADQLFCAMPTAPGEKFCKDHRHVMERPKTRVR